MTIGGSSDFGIFSSISAFVIPVCRWTASLGIFRKVDTYVSLRRVSRSFSGRWCSRSVDERVTTDEGQCYVKLPVCVIGFWLVEPLQPSCRRIQSLMWPAISCINTASHGTSLAEEYFFLMHLDTRSIASWTCPEIFQQFHPCFWRFFQISKN